MLHTKKCQLEKPTQPMEHFLPAAEHPRMAVRNVKPPIPNMLHPICVIIPVPGDTSVKRWSLVTSRSIIAPKVRTAAPQSCV